MIVPALKAVALGVGAYAGWRAYGIFYDAPLDFDDALPWYALAFALLIYAAWTPAMRAFLTWPARAARYVRAHPLEMAALAVVFGVAVFARTWKYGVLPPGGFLCCEEVINAGVAIDVEAGARPMNYPLVRYPTAFGLWAFGGNTDGLRIPFVTFGIAAIVPFYLLMRELVRAPAALFATALFASSHALGDTSSHLQPGLFVSITFAFAVVRGFKTANPMWWLVAGFLAAELSYEYETYKMVPLVFAVFVIIALLHTLVWPPTKALRTLGARALALARRGWFPALIFALTAAIAVTPMLARSHHGEDIYRGSLNRQQASREATGLERYLSPNWRNQTTWVTQIYTPFVEQKYPHGTSIDALGVVDKATSVLLWIGALAATLMFWRRWRVLFLLWFVGGSAALALMVQIFAAWKLVGFLAPGMVLAGLLVDDLWTLAARYNRVAVAGLATALVVAVGFALGANLFIQHSNASDDRVLALYASDIYATCDYARDRPEGNFTYLAQPTLAAWGFAQPRRDRASERVAWRGEFFACRGLQGQTVPSGEEIWPAMGTAGRPVTFAFAASPSSVELWRDSLERAMPELGEPDFVLQAPADRFQVVGYELPAGELSRWRGLGASYRDNSGQARTEVVDPTEMSLPEGAEARLVGLVRVPAAAEDWALGVAGADARVLVDGEETFRSRGDARSVSPLTAPLGWHVLEATLSPSDEPARFQWLLPGGRTLRVFPHEFFALADTAGWRHLRTIERDTGYVRTLARFDFEPHVARRELTDPVLSRLPPPPGWSFGEDIWSAVWHVPRSQTYHFEVVTPGSDVELRLDGELLLGGLGQTRDSTQFIATYEVQAGRGEHRLELRFRHTRGDYVGGTLAVTDPAGQAVELDVSPY